MARGIVVIHGIGEQRRGDFLKDIVGPLAGYLESKGGKVDFEPEIALDVPGANLPAQVTLKVFGPGGRFVEEWRVREAHWAAAFRPPMLNEMFRWGRPLAQRQIEAISRIFDNPLNEHPQDNCEEARRTLRAEGPVQRPTVPEEPYPKRTEGFYRNQAFLFKLLSLGLKAAAPGLLPLVWLLLLLRGLPGPPSFIKRWSWVTRLIDGLTKAVNALANALYPMVVQSLGDVKAFLDDPIAADAIRHSLEKALLSFLQDDQVDSITIISHSLGASVSYDALVPGRPVDRFLREHPERRRSPKGDGFRHINWVTVGAALNRTYSMTLEGPSAQARQRFQSPLAESIRQPTNAFFWLNLYARYDPVAAGPIDPALWKLTSVTCAHFKERAVLNNDNLVTDHNSYWQNHDLVWPRLVWAICDEKYPWPETALEEAENLRLIRRRTIEIADHNRRMEHLLGVFLLLGVILLAVAAVAGLVVYALVRLLWASYKGLSYLAFLPAHGLLTLLRRLWPRGP